MAGDAVALRFIPYSERSGELNAGWAVLMAALLLLGVAASVYLVYVLEILKLGGCARGSCAARTRTRPSTRSTSTSSASSRPASSARSPTGSNRLWC